MKAMDFEILKTKIEFTLLVFVVLCFVSACSHHSSLKCRKIEYRAKTCGSTCIPVEIQAQAIESAIRVYSERHGHGDIAARALRKMQTTWYVGDTFYESVLCHCYARGVTYTQDAIGVACRDGVLGNTAFFEEAIHLIEWNVHGRLILDSDPLWTQAHWDTISMLQRMYR